MDVRRGAGEFIVPTDARAEFRAMIQRANRRIKSNLKYIEQNNIKSHEVKNSLAGDFTDPAAWAGKTMPLSRSIKFASEKEYKAFVRHVMKWGADRGQKGDFHAAPSKLIEGYRTNIFKALNTITEHKGISLEKWGGDLPPEIKEKIQKLTPDQLFHFFEYVNSDTGDEEELDSDRVREGSIESYIEYIEGILNQVTKFY